MAAFLTTAFNDKSGELTLACLALFVSVVVSSTPEAAVRAAPTRTKGGER